MAALGSALGRRPRMGLWSFQRSGWRTLCVPGSLGPSWKTRLEVARARAPALAYGIAVRIADALVYTDRAFYVEPLGNA